MQERKYRTVADTSKMFEALDARHRTYRLSRDIFNTVSGNPGTHENSLNYIARVSGLYPWFLTWKFNRFLSSWTGSGHEDMLSPIMYAKMRTYDYATKKIALRGPYISGCMYSPKVSVA